MGIHRKEPQEMCNSGLPLMLLGPLLMPIFVVHKPVHASGILALYVVGMVCNMMAIYRSQKKNKVLIVMGTIMHEI